MAENLESLHVKHKESLWSWHLHVVTKGNLQEVRIEKLVDIEWLKIEANMDVLEVLDVNEEEPVSWFVFLQQVRKGPVLNQLYFRAIKDIQYVMSHLEVTQYIAQDCQELATAWLHLLALCKACILGTWDFSVPVTPVVSAVQAADMDIVDVLHPGVGKGVLVGGSA
ncbi:unnamed protein product [Sphagnum compactum]